MDRRDNHLDPPDRRLCADRALGGGEIRRGRLRFDYRRGRSGVCERRRRFFRLDKRRWRFRLGETRGRFFYLGERGGRWDIKELRRGYRLGVRRRSWTRRRDELVGDE